MSTRRCAARAVAVGLIEAVAGAARAAGAPKMYWLTQADNAVARRLLRPAGAAHRLHPLRIPDLVIRSGPSARFGGPLAACNGRAAPERQDILRRDPAHSRGDRRSS